MTTVERIAAWAATLTLDAVPPAVVELARTQRRSVLAAIAASAGDGAAARVQAAVADWSSDGPAPLVGARRTVRVEDALYAAAARSISLDFDDYACFGHTGHSAVLVPLLLASEHPAAPADVLAAQLAAGELAARLGGACLIGPLNGQLWSFIHAAAGALGAGRVLGLDANRLAHALAISLYQAPRPTVPGFMAPDSKLLTAADPALVGLRAARLAAAGVTGPLDVLDHPQGMLAAFAFAPLPSLLGGLGEGWAIRTLCVKPYPGCAYVDTTVDALLSLGDELPPPAEIREVVVDAGVLTCGMDGLSQSYAGAAPSPVTINFSIPWNVAIVLTAGRLTPDEVNERWLADHHDELATLASRVTLRHDWRHTLRTAEAMAPLLPAEALGRGVGRRSLLAGIRRVRAEHAALHVRPGDAVELVRALRHTSGPRAAASWRAGSVWDDDALARFEMAFPSQVRVRTSTGRELVADADVPRGGAGSRTLGPEAASREKLAAWGPKLWGEETDAVAKAIDADDDATLLKALS